jgi:hypothetical protein
MGKDVELQDGSDEKYGVRCLLVFVLHADGPHGFISNALVILCCGFYDETLNSLF